MNEVAELKALRLRNARTRLHRFVSDQLSEYLLIRFNRALGCSLVLAQIAWEVIALHESSDHAIDASITKTVDRYIAELPSHGVA